MREWWNDRGSHMVVSEWALVLWLVFMLGIALCPAGCAYAQVGPLVLTVPEPSSDEEVSAKAWVLGATEQTAIDTDGRVVMRTGKGPWKEGEARIVIDTKRQGARYPLLYEERWRRW